MFLINFMQVVKKNIFGNLMVYSLAHFLIDATCAAVIFNLYFTQKVNSSTLFLLVILYNLLAFGFQPFIGLLTDKYKCPRESAVIGSILVGLSAIFVLFSPIISIILAGIGNAFFHIGGGTITLNLDNRKATMPGIFVAPGALGLFVGTLIGKIGNFSALPFVICLLVACFLMYIIKTPKIDYDTSKTNTNYLELILLLLLLTIALRSIVGLAIIFPWKSTLSLLVALTFGVVLGKALGGYLGDKFGWKRVAIISLLVSAPLLFFGVNYPLLGILGMFLFNMTMPITLTAISNTIPGRPGFAFGLTCLALEIGGILTFTSLKNTFSNNYVILAMVLISTVVIYLGLKYYNKVNKK